MAMLGDSILLVQSHLRSIDNRLANLEEALTGISTPQNSMADLPTLDLTSGELDFVSTSAVGEHINPSNYSVTPSSQSLPFPSSSIPPLIDSLPREQQIKIRALRDKVDNRTSYVRGAMDITLTKEEMADSNYDGSRNKRKLNGTKVKLNKCKCVYLILTFN